MVSTSEIVGHVHNLIFANQQILANRIAKTLKITRNSSAVAYTETANKLCTTDEKQYQLYFSMLILKYVYLSIQISHLTYTLNHPQSRLKQPVN